MPTLTPLWRFLEDRPGAEAVLDAWRSVLGPVFGVVEPLLKATGEAASSYPRADRYAPPLRVVRHKDGSVVGVCPEGSGERRELAASDLAVFAIDRRRLRKAIAGALGLAVSHATIDPRSPLLPAASWAPKPSASFRMVVCFATSPATLWEHVLSLVTGADQPMLVATPTRRHWPEGLAETCGRSKAALFPLDEVVESSADTFAATAAWPATLAAFAKAAGLTLPESFGNKRPKRKRGERTAKIDALKKALVDHIRAARDAAHTSRQRSGVARLLPRPTKGTFAKLAGVGPHDVSRCFRDDPQLEVLWNGADDLDFVMNFG